MNNLAVSGAKPVSVICSVLSKKGRLMETLQPLVGSMETAAVAAEVSIVTGETKVVECGSADKLFINATGIRVICQGIEMSAHNLREGVVC